MKLNKNKQIVIGIIFLVLAIILGILYGISIGMLSMGIYNN